jgi:pyruvate,water dikinase
MLAFPDIIWLGDVSCHDARLTGGKAAALSRLAARYTVPPGFCITSGALAGIPAPPACLPELLRAAVCRAYETMPQTPAVAVRSSAVDEDGLATSFAGVHESVLNVRGAEPVVAAVERCRESFFSERALAYRREHGLDNGGPGIAVLVQQQVLSDVSIIAFSANPVTGNRAEMVITAAWGLGESLVGGTVTPDTWMVRHDDGALLDERIGEKRRMTVAVDGGVREVDVPRILRGVPALQTEQVAEVARLAAALQVDAGHPVDIECAIAGGQLYLLQCRPITTLND